MPVLDTLLELFTWIGFGVGGFLAVVTAIIVLVDGTWLPATAVVEDLPDGRVVRWFTESQACEGRLSPEENERIGDAETVQIYYRLGTSRVRLTARARVGTLIWRFTGGFVALGMLAFLVSFVVMFVRG